MSRDDTCFVLGILVGFIPLGFNTALMLQDNLLGEGLAVGGVEDRAPHAEVNGILYHVTGA